MATCHILLLPVFLSYSPLTCCWTEDARFKVDKGEERKGQCPPRLGLEETGERARASGHQAGRMLGWVTGTLGGIACAGGRALGVDRAFLGNLTF